MSNSGKWLLHVEVYDDFTSSVDVVLDSFGFEALSDRLFLYEGSDADVQQKLQEAALALKESDFGHWVREMYAFKVSHAFKVSGEIKGVGNGI